MWRKRLRLAIAVFVVLFAAVVAVSFQKGRAKRAAQAPPVRQDPKATVENVGGGTYERMQQGKVTFALKFGTQYTYSDGRTKLGRGVKLRLPEKNGRTVTIESREMEVLNPPSAAEELSRAEINGSVTMKTSDGLTVKSAHASYNKSENIVRIPGPVTFAKERMTGNGIGATYDLNRDVLWLLDRARVDVSPDQQGGGVIHVTSGSAGLAQNEHYAKFVKNAHMEGEGRIIDTDESTVRLTSDDKRVQRMELRGNARITGTAQGGNASQSMRANNIDLGYADDGRTLQTANLMENASLDLPGQAGMSARRISGRTIQIGMAPDGSTVTSLKSMDGVQVDLPASGETPARRIRAASLAAAGPEGVGLQTASFTGSVEYREARQATKKLAAIDRTVRSQRLDVVTKPGFGDLERADFHGNVHLVDGADTTADAPFAVYNVPQDRLDLSPSPSGDPGKGPHVANGRITVDAARIQMTLGTQRLAADTKVKSVLEPQDRSSSGKASAAAPRGGSIAPVPPLASSQRADSVHVPAMLKQNEPVNVTANRLDYDGANSRATYTGNARLWQDDTVVQADKIVLDDRTGNLHATTAVRTVMTLTQNKDKPAGKPGQKSAKANPAEQTTTVAEELIYEDDKRRATYTTKAHMNGPDGDVTADKIVLYLTKEGNELERAEADGNVVSRQQSQNRRAYGDHLTYIAARDEYTMVGKPVKVFDDAPPECKLTVGTTLTFHKAVDTISATGNGVSAGTRTETIACGTAGQR